MDESEAKTLTREIDAVLDRPAQTRWHLLAETWRPRLQAEELPIIERMLAALDAEEPRYRAQLAEWAQWNTGEMEKRGAKPATLRAFRDAMKQALGAPGDVRGTLMKARALIDGLNGETIKTDIVDHWYPQTNTREPQTVYAIRALVRRAEAASGGLVGETVINIITDLLPRLAKEMNGEHPSGQRGAIEPADGPRTADGRPVERYARSATREE